MGEHQPPPLDMVWRTGTEHVIIVEAHPSHEPVGRHDHQGAGASRRAYRPECPRCHEEGSIDDAD
jgi:hypothetical protein